MFWVVAGLLGLGELLGVVSDCIICICMGLVVSGTFAGLLHLGFCLLLGWCLVALCCFVGLVRFPGTFLVFRMVWMWNVGFLGILL